MSPRLLADPSGKKVVRLDDGTLVPYALYSLSKTSTPPEMSTPAPESPGLARFFSQGALVNGPSNIAGLGDLALGRGFAGAAPGTPSPGEMGVTVPPAGTRLADRTRFAMAGLTGLPEQMTPQTTGERLAQSAGAGITESIPFLGAGGPAMRALTLGSGALSEMAGGEVRAGGGGPGSQLAAALLAGASPGVVRGIVKGAAGAYRYFRPTAETSYVTGVGAAAKAGSAEIPPEMRAEAQQLLDAEAAKPLFGQATTEQVLGDRFPGVTGIAKRVAADPTVGPTYRARVAANNAANAEAGKALAAQEFGGGGPLPPTVLEYQKRLSGFQKAVDAAYIKAGDLQGLPIDNLANGLAQVRLLTEPNAIASQPANVMKIMEKYSRRALAYPKKRFTSSELANLSSETRDTLSLNELRQLDSVIGDTWHNDGVPLPPFKQKLLGILQKSVDDTLDQVAEAGGTANIEALRKAIKLRKMQGERFNPNDPLYHLLSGNVQGLDLDKAFAKFLDQSTKPQGLTGRLKAPGPARSLEIARETLRGNPQAWAGVQELVDRQVFGPEFEAVFPGGQLSDTGAKKALSQLRKYGAAVDVVRGPGSADRARDFLKRAEQLGTQRVNLQQAPGLPGESPVLGQAATAGEIATWNLSRAAIRGIWYALHRPPKSMQEMRVVMANMLYDPRIGKGFLKALPEAEAQAWGERLRVALKQSAVRQGARSLAGVTGSPEENQP